MTRSFESAGSIETRPACDGRRSDNNAALSLISWHRAPAPDHRLSDTRPRLPCLYTLLTAGTGPELLQAETRRASETRQTDVASPPRYDYLNYNSTPGRPGTREGSPPHLMITGSHHHHLHRCRQSSSSPRSATTSEDFLDCSFKTDDSCADEMAFAANGTAVNRHLRNHRNHPALGSTSPSHSCTDSEGGASSDSERPLKRRLVHQGEYNNNEVAKRKSPELLLEQHVKRSRLSSPEEEDAEDQRRIKSLLLQASSNGLEQVKDEGFSESSQSYSCTVCGKQDFPSSALLDAHVQTSHPEIYDNRAALGIRRLMMNHANSALSPKSLHNSVVGFNDLTFVDFSSGKFPAIARAVCEQSLHRPASGETPKYQCSKCLRAFPCRSALEGHETDCGHLTVDHHRLLMRENQNLRDDFFANLDLQNKAALAEAKEGKDLADIQSIISVTSGQAILQNFSRSDASTPDNCKIKQNNNNHSSGSSGTPSSEHHEEEAQDAFAAEFRKMKMKGEFPCRLCDTVFPNLRALKGHNRVHLNAVGPGMPIPCNMCPYSSTDKNTLQRHLRSHNGDRPYECSLCNFAFTTKANCERHVRNRHGMNTRDEIKNALIYHPSEDSTNDTNMERNSSPRAGGITSSDEVRKTLVYSSDREELPASHYPEIRIKEESKLRQPASIPGLISVNHFDKNGLFPATRPLPSQPLELGSYEGSKLQEQPRKRIDEDNESRSSEGSVSLVSETKPAQANQRIHQASPIDLKKSAEPSSPEEGSNSNNDAPLDLSMDVLDLSKRAAAAAAAAAKEKESEVSVETLAKNAKDYYNHANQLLLTQALIKAGQVGVQPPSFESLYANPHMVYPNFGAFPGIGASMIPPYLFSPFGAEFAMKDRLQKELVRGLQTSGGRLVDGDYTPEYSSAAFPSRNSTNATDYQKDFSKISKKNAPVRDKRVESPSSNSVKMVYKNGCFMPKQKQRRYRTERPFKCQHCSAGFTLRSNMERHIKQQHPQHWKQRIRGAHSTRGRPPANPPTLVQSLRQPMQMSAAFPTHLSKLDQSMGPDYGKHAISDQVKYAILAQQLKGTKPEDNESDEELIIDESKESKEPTERTLSLLRDKLEANIESKSSESKENEQPFKEVKHELNESETAKSVDVKEEESIMEVKTEINVDKKMEYSESQDLASVSEILDNASQHYQHFQPQYMSDEEGLVASTSDCNQSGSDEKSDSVNSGNSEHSSHSFKKKKMTKKKKKKKSAYSMAPNRVICPYCQRPFPWHSSLRRHVLTHTGQKPFRCSHCSLLFTTKSNCDRHLLRKHKKELGLKVRRTRSISSPEIQEPPPPAPEPIPVAPPTLAPSPTNNNSAQFSMRNVPERPYKCNKCPSSTFSTIDNLRKHRTAKHGIVYTRSRPDTPLSNVSSCREYCSLEEGSPPEHPEDLEQSTQDKTHEEYKDDQSGYESQSSGVSDHCMETNDLSKNASGNNTSSSTNEAPRSRKTSPRSSPGPVATTTTTNNNNGPETPFKCHLCDSGFSERNDCLDHIKDNHEESYEMLMAKGQARGLEMDDQFDEPMPNYPQQSQAGEGGEVKRGRFPDYSNRKVVCAFCMRRFWSAEDLRRHMRTHTGERPFFCNICYRKFTLKHSMLRHRKKHDSSDSNMYVGTSGDEDGTSLTTLSHQPATITPRHHQPSSSASSASSIGSSSARLQERTSLPQVASVATGDAAPSGFIGRFNPYDKLSAASMSPASNCRVDANDNEDKHDLISHLLGFDDKSIIDQALQAPSVDVAAKIIGVKGNHEYEDRNESSM